jgi:hypothetical protein
MTNTRHYQDTKRERQEGLEGMDGEGRERERKGRKTFHAWAFLVCVDWIGRKVK